MIDLTNFMPYLGWVIIGIGVLAIIPYFIIFSLLRRLKRFEKGHLALQTFMKGETLDELLNHYIARVKEVSNSLGDQESRIIKIEEKLRKSIDRAELMRFNAFENMGSDLSFALAFMNQEGDGVVLSSINSREESRVYAKPIAAGESSYHLSEEEKQVLLKAQETLRV